MPATGADVDVWGELDVNPNMVAVDGLFAGTATISLTNLPVTLSAPTGSITPSAGPTQSQNRVLRFTGSLSADVLVTLPLPGVYVIDNRTIPGASGYIVQLRGAVATTEVVALPPGICTIANDGSNVRFVSLGNVGTMEMWAGLSAMPRWVGLCTVPPYLLCAGSTTYSFTTYPLLGPRMGSTFGGNGITTFGVPDMAGRLPLAYDSTGTRITTAGCSINGQTLGASADAQSSQLVTANLPAITPAGTISGTALVGWATDQYQPPGGGARNAVSTITTGSGGNSAALTVTAAFTGTLGGGTSQIFSNVPPAQVVGIWVIRAA